MAKKPTPRVIPEVKSNIQNTRSGLDPEAESRFELELCWCIQQLETSLRDSMPHKQAEVAMKTLNVLKSGNSSLIKKRQFMRNMFGDYRQKMADDEKKFSKLSAEMKFTNVKKDSQKSVFYKKANKNVTPKDKLTEDKDEKDSSENAEPFKFNFTNSET